jgi:hypothetical protein
MKLSSPWRLMRHALRRYRQNWKVLLGLILVVSVPVAIASVAGGSGDGTLSAYLTFAQLTMNAALIYAVARIVNGEDVGIRQAYYRGSAMLVRLVLLSGLLLLLLLPLALGLYILTFGLLSPGADLALGEKLLTAGLALLIIVPGLIPVVRGIWGTYRLFDSEDGPVKAVIFGWQVSRGRTWASLGRLAALVVMLLGLVILPLALLVTAYVFTKSALILILLQIVVAAIVLPLTNLYMYQYYQELKA